MDLKMKTAAVLGALALLMAPAVALANGPEYAPEHTHPTHPTTPGPKAPLPAKAKAYGVYCRGASKQHVKGEKGTAFSRCVTSMAKAANGATPKAACKSEPKTHEAGKKGTPYSRCIVNAARLQKEQAEAS
ncbi:MAG: hypothetical protein JSU06_18270 [Actinobacteria bacterium]|nr:hypothetical protein [Actinomycetota bacterium]